MARYDREGALNPLGGPAASLEGRIAWAFFDWANQPFFTIVSSFLFVAYFYNVVVGDPVEAQTWQALLLAISGVSIAVLSPIFGAIADVGGRRKPWLLGFSVIFCISVFALWWAEPNATQAQIIQIVCLLIVAGVSMELCVVFNNAMLPSVARADSMGALSGFGFGIGYVGGMVALIFIMLLFQVPEEPFFGISKEAHEHDRIVGPWAAVWYALFVLPLFLLTPDRPSARKSVGEAVVGGLKTLGNTFGHLRRYKNIALFLFARMIYQDGLSAMFAFGAAYAIGMFAWEGITAGAFGLILLVFAAAGAILGGFLDDKIGPKPTLYIALSLLSAGAILSLSITPESILFGIPVAPADPDDPLLSMPELMYLFAGMLVGIGGGPTQAASRTLMARLAPKGLETEFFGLYALAGKATSWLAPLAIFYLTLTFGAQRPGLFAILAFLFLGWALLVFVKVERAEPVAKD